jgi:glycosyltransferase involved in cell wall biosynthesis
MGSHISNALNSILSQTIQDFEIIVVNDGSTDDGRKIVQTFDDARITLINQQNKGEAIARNQGVKYAKADIIAFLDADDLWLSNFLETVFKLIEKYPQAGVFATGIAEIIDNKEVVQRYRTIPNNGYEGIIPDFFKSIVSGDRFITCSSVALKKTVFLDASGFRYGATWGADSDLWARIALKYPIAFNSKICSKYFIIQPVTKMNARIAITKEHPFIKNGTDYILKNQDNNKYSTYLQVYIDKLKIWSARENLMIGHSESAREILVNCKNYKIQKYALLVWTILPEYMNKMFGKYLFRLGISCIKLFLKIKRQMYNRSDPLFKYIR